MIVNLEVGASYLTRNGSTVTIEHNKGGHPYPFYGLIASHEDPAGRIAYFASNGSYNLGHESVFDITGPANVHD